MERGQSKENLEGKGDRANGNRKGKWERRRERGRKNGRKMEWGRER